jgi:hypothetical protein
MILKVILDGTKLIHVAQDKGPFLVPVNIVP